MILKSGILSDMHPSKLSITAFAACLVLPVALGQSPSLPACPADTGAYYMVGGAWKPMDAAHSIGFKTTGVAAAAFSYGAAKAHVKAQFRDAHSPYQIHDGGMAICLVGLTDNGRDISLAKLQTEKDRRELEMASMRLWTGVNAQLDPRSVVPIDVEKLSEKVYRVTTKEPLPDGEFILFTIIPDVQAMVKANTPSSLGGYDLGNHSK